MESNLRKSPTISFAVFACKFHSPHAPIISYCWFADSGCLVGWFFLASMIVLMKMMNYIYFQQLLERNCCMRWIYWIGNPKTGYCKQNLEANALLNNLYCISVASFSSSQSFYDYTIACFVAFPWQRVISLSCEIWIPNPACLLLKKVSGLLINFQKWSWTKLWSTLQD